jgi:hypothetical protein
VWLASLHGAPPSSSATSVRVFVFVPGPHVVLQVL